MNTILKIPLLLIPQPDGEFTVTSPALPELVTGGDTVEEALENLNDAMRALLEYYADARKPVPTHLCQKTDGTPISFEYLWSAPEAVKF